MSVYLSFAPHDGADLLRTQEPGTFLVRFSSNSHYPTWFTISKVLLLLLCLPLLPRLFLCSSLQFTHCPQVSSDGKVRSIRVEHEPGTDVRPLLLCLAVSLSQVSYHLSISLSAGSSVCVRFSYSRSGSSATRRTENTATVPSLTYCSASNHEIRD
jgi:hypothetical protein